MRMTRGLLEKIQTLQDEQLLILQGALLSLEKLDLNPSVTSYIRDQLRLNQSIQAERDKIIRVHKGK